MIKIIVFAAVMLLHNNIFSEDSVKVALPYNFPDYKVAQKIRDLENLACRFNNCVGTRLEEIYSGRPR